MLSEEEVRGRLKSIELEALKIKSRPVKWHGANFYKHLQEKGNEVKLERVRHTQLHTMKRIMYKDKHIDRADWKDEFCLFWAGFLKGEYKNINEYLKRK